MMLQLVTDRRRLALEAGTDLDRARELLIEQTRAAVAAGIDLLQVREPDIAAGALSALVVSLVALAKGTTTRVVVNDRMDVALASGASGVHLKGTSPSAARVRALAPPGFLIGRSVHHLQEAREEAEHVDYLVAGSVFPTVSKPDTTAWLGVDGLAAIVRAVSVPVLGIGGITPDRVADVARSGAAGVAAIGLFIGYCGSRGHRRAVPLDTTVRTLRAMFDTSSRPS